MRSFFLALLVAHGALCAGCLGGNEFEGGPEGPPPFDCEAILHPPFEIARIEGPTVYEDFAFDDQGNLIGWRDGALFKSPYDGEPQPFASGVPTLYGMRHLPNGDLVAADGETGSLLRIEPDGTQHTVLSGLGFPNGVTVDLAGQVYVGEFSGNRVRRVDPMTGDFTMLLDGDVPSPNGISFDPTYTLLYIGGWAEHILYTLEILEDGTPGALTPWYPDTLGGLLHGLGTDLCGNVYATEIMGGMYGGSSGTVTYRIPAAGGAIEILFDSDDTGETGILFSNLEWGSGIGGWDASKLYLGQDYMGVVYEVPIGVPPKPRPYPPLSEE